VPGAQRGDHSHGRAEPMFLIDVHRARLPPLGRWYALSRR
jgi:hypothetical protein